MNGNFQWPPLESDPEIFTEYSRKVGSSESDGFGEIYSLDYKELQIQEIDTPVYSVIVSYEENQKLERENGKFKPSAFVPFYMKQTQILDNACGLIAMLHSIGNNLDNMSLKQDSILQKFFDENKGKSSDEIAKNLENFSEFKTAHGDYASMGQSEHCAEQSDVKNHFVAFIYHQGNLIELDGLIQGPYVVKENIKDSELLDETIAEIKRRLENGAITENLSLMFLTKF
jgi:ubiquitin carboxyl-terminal hydrolase L3